LLAKLLLHMRMLGRVNQDDTVNAEGEELACQNVRSWGEPDTPGWRE
jgi:hypothetical protein